MCGISAIIKTSESSLSRAEVEKFNRCITHRGPDGEGLEAFNHERKVGREESWDIMLGHRRLSILDLSENGKQPMSYAHEKLWIVFNGEIYNYVELKEELIKKGYQFHNATDTEVILAAYQEWGTNAFSKLRGMWAFVIVDFQKKKIVICRDRMGIKPLYYFQSPIGYVAFSSEIKQLLSLPNVKAVANRIVIKQYLLTGFEHTDRTFFDQIIPVLPGTFLEIELGQIKLGEANFYWKPEEIKPSITNVEEASYLFKQVLEESVKIHLRSDVPVGCQLSGGLDSSTIFALMQKYYKGVSIHSFTVQFKNYEKDETSFVQKMLEGSDAMPHFITPNTVSFEEDLRKFIWHHDEPVGSFSHYAGFILAKLISDQKIKVVLNGQGGDEILGGYWQQYFTYLLSLGKAFQLRSLGSHLLGALRRDGNEELWKQLPAIAKRFQARKKVQYKFTDAFEKEPSLRFFKDYFGLSLQERRVFEIRNLILPRLLKWDDRNLMAFGIEGRYPFLDHHVIETALSFNTQVLFKKGWTKYPLRHAMKDSIPREIYFRKSKWGFETPQQDWLKNSLRPMLTEWLKRDKPLDQVLDTTEVHAMADRFWKHNKLEDAQALLRLFLLDQWMEVFSVRL